MNAVPSPTVTRVLANHLCSGCGLCASVSEGALAMQDVAPGYNRPVARGSGFPASAEPIVAAACPGATLPAWDSSAQSHPYWGPYRRVLTGYASDADVRFQASSGGVLTALLAHMLEEGLVDRVVQVAADPDRPTRNVVTCSRTAAELLQAAGSRYTASSPLARIDDILSEGGAVAFVGKPCDASALRALAKVDPRVDRHVRYILSFFCGGVPSHGGVDRILAALGVEGADVARFRYRGNGWPGSAAATLGDGSTAQMSYAESWGAYLSKEVQFRCKICPDAVGGVADIACADAWYGDENGYPSFDEQQGRSLVMARTEAGDSLIAAAVERRRLVVEPLEVSEIDRMQPAQARRKRLVQARLAALATALKPRPAMSGLMVGEAARRAPIREALHNYLGTLRRVVLNRW